MTDSGNDLRLYFAYGSNLSLKQMEKRCPDSSKLGIAVLPQYRWGISCRGYANIYQSDEHVIYGVLYTLSAKDEKYLDRMEGVAIGCYDKFELEVIMYDDYISNRDNPVKRSALVYIDPRLEEGRPKEEYIGRMKAGLEDAQLPEGWVNTYILPLLY
ncbi:SubName: Full=Uncharacterized protein {ECO:0000313/EMBL:CCA75414.1} [Serendipita indica DSM 11827]|uniref:gamma-glutamylcyclotransferase n=1 Tax=Serendipita indica (strain DSM 11827) TaxID=1109443 RepID=G4TVS1_SERID|nr:SubName: Full=Uncharacterized protein {ECO:0000313/EMBL:CCA75414.1} [Serendipita indica DSM 11827]CCA75414.1 hypothetical protein PIIN_09397 [Serendipita indica DSM 11827]